MRTSPLMQQFLTAAAGRNGFPLAGPAAGRLILRQHGAAPLVVEVPAAGTVRLSDYNDPEEGVLEPGRDEPALSCEYFTGGRGWILTRVWPVGESLPVNFARVAEDGGSLAEVPGGGDHDLATAEIERQAASWMDAGWYAQGEIR